MKNASLGDSFQSDGSSARVSLFTDVKVDGIGLVFEEVAWSEGFRFVAGVDEVGRGCIAGPVVAAACILDPAKELPDGIDDSKKLTPEKREEIAAWLVAESLAYGVGQIESDEIDRINILEATKKAMLAAINALEPRSDFLLVDALRLKACPLPQKAIIKGDSISASIAAASILAKTYRDRLMSNYDETFPQYGFAAHKGYGCASHYEAIRENGPCVLHRMTFKGVVAENNGATLF